MDEATKKQLEEYDAQIKVLEGHRKRTFIASMVLFGAALLSIIGIIVTALLQNDVATIMMIVFIVLVPLCIASGIALLMIRSLIIDVKLANRNRIINKENSLEREKENPASKDNKIGF